MTPGSVMMDLTGLELTTEEIELLQHPQVGGVILFARNFQDREQLVALTRSIRRLRSPELLIVADQEGGRVQRFKEGFSRLPAAGQYRQYYQDTPNLVPALIRASAWLMASELQAAGIDFSFAPVLDIDRGMNSVVGDRAFGDSAKLVSDLGQHWFQGTRQAGMVCVGKHFPGHGGVTADSHLTLPVDEREFDVIWQEDLYPFQQLVQQGLEAVMPAHVVYQTVNNTPAGFSSFWLKDILRSGMNFNGAIISDALDMLAAATIEDNAARAKAALRAGCDAILLCNDRPAAIEVLEELEAIGHQNLESSARLMRLYSRQYHSFEQLHKHPRWLAVSEQLKALQNKSEAGHYDPTTRGDTII